jgi:hypothetical protein
MKENEISMKCHRNEISSAWQRQIMSNMAASSMYISNIEKYRKYQQYRSGVMASVASINEMA